MLRRWFPLALLLLCVAVFTAANAESTLALDEIGLRYTPAEGETLVTRESVTAQALSALGTDEATLSGVMARDGLYLIGLQTDGRQFTLSVEEKPDGVTGTDAASMSAAQKDAFLTELARIGGYGNASWQSNGFALFTSPLASAADAALQYSSISLATLYLNRVYTFHMDIIGREQQQADIDLLLATANRTLLLGAKTSGQTAEDQVAETLTLPSTAVATQPAALTYSSQALALTLDPIAATIGVTQFVLSGTTVPNGSLRYIVNGDPSSRIKADENGAFRFTVPNLIGNTDNAIELTAFKDDQKTIVSFTVTVDWQLAPVVLAPIPTVEGKSVTISGLALPSSSVELTKGRGAKSISVGADGAFSTTLLLSRAGENSFTLQVQSAGYHRNDYSFTVTRTLSVDEALQTLTKKVRNPAYQKLVAKPSAYQDVVLQLSGTAQQLAYNSGSPSFILQGENGESYTVLCTDLLSVNEGAAVTLLGTLTGSLADGSGYPVLTLAVFVP